MQQLFSLHSVQTKLALAPNANFLVYVLTMFSGFIKKAFSWSTNKTTSTTPLITSYINDDPAFVDSLSLLEPVLVRQYTLQRTEGKLVPFNKVGETNNTASQKTQSSINFLNRKSMFSTLRLLGITLSVILLSFVTSFAFGQTVQTDKADYYPGEYVIITGSGWQPGETVTLHFDETPKPATCLLSHDLTTVADANGNISNNQFLIKENHRGVYFYMTATGQSSGLIADNWFTDATITSNGTSGDWGSASTWTATTRTGTIAYTNVSNQVVGTGTSFTTELAGGSIITTTGGGAITRTVASVQDNTHLTLTTNANSTQSGKTFNAQVVPFAGDAVIILSGDNVTVNGTFTCASLLINSGNNATAILGFAGSGNPSLTVTGTVWVGSNGNQNQEGTITFTSGSTLNCGNIVNGRTGNQTSAINMADNSLLKVNGPITVLSTASTWSPSTGTVELTANNTLPATVFTSFNNLKISSGTTTSGVNLSVSGTMTVDGAFNPGATHVISGAGTLTGAGTVQVTRTTATPDFLSQYAITNKTLTNLNVDYSGSGTQNINPLSYFNLTLSGTGNKNFTGTTIIAGTFKNTAGTMVPSTSTVVFTGGSGSIDGATSLKQFNNLLIDAGASLLTTATAGNIQVNGSFTNNGIFTQNSGQTTSFGGLSQTLFGTGLTTFGSITVQSGTTVNAGSHNFTIVGTFNVSSTGTFNGNSGAVSFAGSTSVGSGAGTYNFNNVTINSGTLSNSTNNKSFSVIGNWTNNGTYTAGAETISFTGAAQNITGNNPTTFNGLFISGTGDKVLGNDITVNGTLTLNNRNIDATTNSKTVYAKGGVTRNVSGHVIGNLKKDFSAPSNLSKTFEIGTTLYAPVTVNFNSVTSPGTLTARTDEGDHLNIATSNINTTKSINRNWSITKDINIGFTTYGVTFNYNTGENDDAPVASSYILGKYDGTTWSYPPITPSPTSTELTASGINNFSGFAIGKKKNSAPTGTDNSVTTNEDVDYTFTTTNFGFTDPNDVPANNLLAVKITTLPANGTLKLSGTPVTAGDFISATNITGGNLKFTPGGHASGTPYETFTFQVQDDGGTASSGADLDATPNTITINVNPVNDAPNGADKTVTTNEDIDYTFASADFGFTDPVDAPNTFLAVKITTLPLNGLLKLSGSPVSGGDFISAANITGGNLKFSPATNANGSPYTTFTFQVQDDGGTSGSGVDLDVTPNTITINVTAVNDAPVLTAVPATATIDEEVAYSFDANATDHDVPAQTLTFSLGATAPTGAGINSSTGVFSWTPAETQGPGSYTFDVIVSDGSLTDTRSITITVSEVNVAPAGTNKTATTLEDNAYTFLTTDFGFVDAHDIPANTLAAVKITTLPVAGFLKLNGITVTLGQFITTGNINSGNLKFEPAANANGTGYASFTFQVQDNGGTTNGVDLDQTPNTMTINVTAVNDAPVVNSIDPPSPTVQYSDPISVTINVSDVDNTSLKATSITGLPSGLSLSPAVNVANTTGVWTVSGNVTAAPGSYPVAVIISDGNLSTTESFTIEVQAENALVDYTGVEFASTGTANATTANVTLSATLTDINDGTRGNITKAQVRFKIVPLGCSNLAPETAIYSGWINVALLSADPTIGAASFQKILDIGNCNAKTFEVYVETAGWYTAPVFITTVTVSKSLNDYVTGGGHLKFGAGANNKSSGVYKSDDNSKTNYGFNVKYNKSNTNLQGNVNIIIRSGSKNYHVKGIVGGSNGSLNTNVSSATDKKAILTAKGNITDGATGLQVPYGSNADVELRMSDRGEPGANDLLAVTIKATDGTLLYSSEWAGTTTNERVIGGGNIQVNSTLVGAPTTTTLKASISSSTAGAPVTFTATISKGSNVNTPTGMVSFKDGATTLTTVNVLTTGGVTTATFTTTSLTVGTHSITALYSGDARFNASVSPAISHVVSANPAASINASATSQQLDQPVATFNLKASPNPTTSQFNLKLESSDSRTLMTMKVIDLSGKVIEARKNLIAGQILQIGATYRPGMYMVELWQGKLRKVVKLIKQPD